MTAISHPGGWTATASAITSAMAKAKLQHTARYVPPEDDTVDGEIEIVLADVATGLAVQVGPYGASLNSYQYRDGDLVSMTMLKSFDHVVTKEVCVAVIEEVKKRMAG